MLKRILLLLIVLLICTTTFAFAIGNLEYYNPGDNLDPNDEKVVVDVTANVLKYIRYFGIILSIIILNIIGLKYILASAEEKASYKENMIPYFIGCVLLLTSTLLPGIIYQAVHH